MTPKLRPYQQATIDKIKAMAMTSPRILSPSAPDLVGVPDVVRDYLDHRPMRRAVAFCATIEHARSVAKMFNDNDIKAETILGEDMPMERAAKVARFNAGETMLLCGVDVMNEMIVQAEMVIMLRPTNSRALFNAQFQKASKAPAMILDYAGNFRRHGIPAWPITD